MIDGESSADVSVQDVSVQPKQGLKKSSLIIAVLCMLLSLVFLAGAIHFRNVQHKGPILFLSIRTNVFEPCLLTEDVPDEKKILLPVLKNTLIIFLQDYILKVFLPLSLSIVFLSCSLGGRLINLNSFLKFQGGKNRNLYLFYLSFY